MPRVAHFEITSKDPKHVIEFYKKTFGWTFEKWDGPMDYWMITTGKGQDGINGGLIKDDIPAAMNTIAVPNIDGYIEKIKTNGGKIVSEKTTIPGVGYLAYFEDSEGNRFGVMQSDMEAKK